MADYVESPSVRGIVQHVIQTEPAHEHLKVGQPNIVCLERKGDWYSKGRVVLAKIDKVKDTMKAVTGWDWILCVNGELWGLLDEKRQIALIDNELSHIEWDVTDAGIRKVDKNDRPIWVKVDYDFYGFIGVIQRHGLWSHDVRRFFEGTKEYVQRDLFGNEVALVDSKLQKEKAEPQPVEETFNVSFDAEGQPVFKLRSDDEQEGAA